MYDVRYKYPNDNQLHSVIVEEGMKETAMSTFRPRPDPRPSLAGALDLAITQSTGDKRYAVRDGRLVSKEYRRYRSTFTLERTWDLPDDTKLQVRSRDFEGLIVRSCLGCVAFLIPGLSMR